MQMLSDHATSLPIFHGHGDADPVVQYKWGQQTIAKLEELGFKSVEFKTYPRAFPLSPTLSVARAVYCE